MENICLGLLIEFTACGADDLLAINVDNRWTRYTGDIAEFNQFEFPNNQSWHILALQKIPSGNLIRIICPNAGRIDYIIASIFIPWNVKVEGRTLEEIVNSTLKEIKSWNRETSKGNLQNIFSHEYNTIDVQEPKEELLNSNQIAYRIYGDFYQLDRLLNSLEQPYYTEYKYIFLIAGDLNIVCRNGRNLTTEKLLESAILNPREHKEFKPYINGKLFDKPIRCFIGDEIPIEWKRNGYKTLSSKTLINTSTQFCEPFSSNDIKREIYPYDLISVIDQKSGLHILNYSLRLNNEALSHQKGFPHYLKENEAIISVEVSADGYITEKCEFNINKPQPVKLKRKKHEYRFRLPYHIGNESGYNSFSMEVEGRIEESPFDGYTTCDGYIHSHSDNYLEYKPDNKRKNLIVLLIASLLSLLIGCCGGLYLGYCVMSSKIEKVEKENNQLKEAKKKEQEKAEQDKKRRAEERKSAIRKYLDETNVWNRSKMEAYPEIAGLWDALNERDFDKILTYKDYLRYSVRFRKVIEAVEKNKDKKFNEKYTQDNDITIEAVEGNKGYIKALTSNSAKTENSKKKDKNKESKKGNDSWY